MDLMTLQARLLLDSSQYEQGLDNSEKRATSFGSKLKKGLGAVAKVGAVAVAGAVAASVALGKKAFDAYANYEQLAGGVETLFGTGGLSLEEYAAKQGKSVDKVRKKYELLQAGQTAVMENAAQAWKTSGMSMNDYMETVTGFSAALVKSTGGDTVKAAKYADMAMTDMSDNANKMGTDISMIQSAYQGFAKQNYTMLDNLKLGYGGTKTEMQRLIKDANKLRKKMGLKPNLNIKNYSDIVEAIHLIQEEMGIMGTTAKEADSTIQGSTNAMKAAWQNLLLGVADDNQDFGTLVDNFIGSFTTVSNNIMPRVKIILEGLGKLFEAFADTILPQIMDILIENAPQLAVTAAKLIATLATALIKALPSLIRQIPTIITAIVKALKENWDDIKQAGVDMLGELAAGLGSDTGSGDGSPTAAMVSLVGSIIKTAIGLLPKFKQAGKDFFGAVADGILEATEEYGNDDSAVDTAGSVFDSKGLKLLQRFGRWIKETALPAIGGAFQSIFDWVGLAFDGFWEDIGLGLGLAWDSIVLKLGGVWEDIKKKAQQIWTPIGNFFAGLWESINKGASEKWETLKKTISEKWDNIKTNASEKIEEIKTTVSEKAEAVKEKFLEPLETLKTNVGEKWEEIKTKFSDAIEKIKGYFKFDWELPKIKLPHFKKIGTTILGLPKIGVDWYGKAYDKPYLFTEPTVVGNKGFGDGGGSGELVYGRDALMRDIREAVGFGGGVTINVYQREGEDTMALSKRIEQDLIKLMTQSRAGALYV